MIISSEVAFYFLLPLVAFIYAAVGHGGASGYLALMALFSFSPEIMKPTALLLNLFVAGISFYLFWKKGYFKWRLFYPFVITSVPAAFIGGFLSVNAQLYKQILGVLLLFAVLRMLGMVGGSNPATRELKLWQGLLVGVVIGFFSGLIGIGGGIILTPLILLLGWASVKETAAISALFIWVNSLAGFSGLYIHGIELHSSSFIFIGLALVGGIVGAYFGSSILKSKGLTRFLSIVLLLASLKLIFA